LTPGYVFEPFYCEAAMFTGGVTATFPATAGVDSALLTIQIPSQTLEGERFVIQ